MTHEVAYNVYKTKDYDFFRFINSNRKIKKTHVNNLISSIEDGYDMPPIIVKNNGEILDGQHRYTALKELDKPIEFIIKENIKQDTLQKSNTLVSKWSTRDHINFHKNEGNDHYAVLQEFMEYSGLNAVTAARLIGTTENKSPSRGIMDGKFKVTNKDDGYQFVDEVLMRIRAEKPTDKLISAFKKIYNVGVDNKRLVVCINALYEELELINRVPMVAERIAVLYNKDLPKNERIKIQKQTNGDIKFK